jgi:hypothetical protein
MTQTFADHPTPVPQFRSLYRSLLVSVVLPLAAVQLLLHRGVPAVQALAIAAIFPFGDTVVRLVRTRRADPIAVLSLTAIVVGLATSGLSGNPGFAVAKESLFTTVFGLVFLGSLLTPRPLIFRLGRQYSTGGDPAAIAAWDARWERPLFRSTIRFMTVVWGCALLIEAALRIVAAFTLPVVTSTILSVVLQIGILGGLFVWSAAYARAVRRRYAAAERVAAERTAA